MKRYSKSTLSCPNNHKDELFWTVNMYEVLLLNEISNNQELQNNHIFLSNRYHKKALRDIHHISCLWLFISNKF